MPHAAPRTIADPEGMGTHAIVWPPPDDVLQKLAVIDFVTGEIRPLDLQPPIAFAPETASGTDVPAVPASLFEPARVRRRGASMKTLWILAVVALLGYGAGAFAAWNLVQRSLQAQAAAAAPAAPSVSRAGAALK